MHKHFYFYTAPNSKNIEVNNLKIWTQRLSYPMTIPFKIDVIQVKDVISFDHFQANVPFSSDSLIAYPKRISRYVEVKRLPIRDLFTFKNGTNILTDCPDDICHFKTELIPSTIVDASHALNVLRRVIEKTRLGWKIDGLGFDIFLEADGEVYMNTSCGEMVATDVAFMFHNTDVKYHNGCLETKNVCLCLWGFTPLPNIDKLLIGTSVCDEFHLVTSEEANEK